MVEDSVQFAALDERHDEVEARFRLKEILHPAEEGIVELEKDVFLKPDLVNDLLIDDLILPN